jgi:hypothetical protein
MRKKILDDKYYMPSQIDIGSAEKDVTEPTETPIPLAKGFDGLPRFNELQDAQKKNMPKAMRSQVAFQQKKLQYSNYQIINFIIIPTDSVVSQAYYFNDYNQGTAVGNAMDSGIMFGTSTADITRAKYYNLVYMNVRFANDNQAATDFILSPSYVEFYPMQKLDTGDFGGKIPKQIESVTNQVNTAGLYDYGAEFGVQSFGVDVYGENAYYTQSPDLKGIRCCGVALKRISLSMQTAISLDGIRLMVECGYDLKTEGNNY